MELLARVEALPAAAPLLARIGDRRGIHLVGGAVRDLLLGRASPDLDQPQLATAPLDQRHEGRRGHTLAPGVAGHPVAGAAAPVAGTK